MYGTGDCGRSLLSKMDRLNVSRTTATLNGEAMVLKLPRDAAVTIADRIDATASIGVLANRDPAVTAALVWLPGQKEPAATFIDGSEPSAFAALFVALIPSDAPADDIQFMEDGYVVLLSADSAARLVNNLRDGSSVFFQGGNPERSLTIAVTR